MPNTRHRRTAALGDLFATGPAQRLINRIGVGRAHLVDQLASREVKLLSPVNEVRHY